MPKVIGPRLLQKDVGNRTDQLRRHKDMLFNLAELASFIDKATAGNCHAAERVGGYYMNYELSYEKAVKWYRVAARCQEVLPKDMLVALLSQVTGNQGVEAEVDRLILEIRAIDPARAEEIAADVDEIRRQASAKGMSSMRARGQ